RKATPPDDGSLVAKFPGVKGLFVSVAAVAAAVLEQTREELCTSRFGSENQEGLHPVRLLPGNLSRHQERVRSLAGPKVHHRHLPGRCAGVTTQIASVAASARRAVSSRRADAATLARV